MKIVVVGTGYVGLVSGICLSKIGHQVICIDQNQEKINQLNQGKVPIFEPGLTEILTEVQAKEKISFSSNLTESLKNACAVFIAVGTPQDQDGKAELSFVIAAVEEIINSSQEDKLIITKSTVPAGTGEKIKKIIATQKNKNVNFYLSSNPEFLREGSAIEDFMNPDRIVIGAEDERAKKIMSEIYQYFPQDKIIFTDIITAELIKYAANSFLATKISFINEIADLCEMVGGDIKKLSSAIGMDKRIGDKFLNPGPGFGGSCFPKDILALLNVAKESNSKLSLIESVISSNQIRQQKIAAKILAFLNEKNPNNQRKIAFLGLAFKGNTDDIRYSPAINIIKLIADKVEEIKAHDFAAIDNAKKELSEVKNISFFNDLYQCCEDVDLIVIATEWQEYQQIDFDKIAQEEISAKKISTKKIFDLRNLFDISEMKRKGFDYRSIGQKI
jgi:UDPglucose 6-dehydrogenase